MRSSIRSGRLGPGPPLVSGVGGAAFAIPSMATPWLASSVSW
jgi:hypothetical protein